MNRPMVSAHDEIQRAARDGAYATPLSEFHPGNPELFRSDTIWPYFERLRNEEPVHFCSTSPVGNYWSVTKYNDIMHVDTSPKIFFVGSQARWHPAARRRVGLSMAELHFDGRAEAQPAAQDRCADVHARPS
jgi:cytochrome P450